jgi:hypothetical protein
MNDIKTSGSIEHRVTVVEASLESIKEIAAERERNSVARWKTLEGQVNTLESNLKEAGEKFNTGLRRIHVRIDETKDAFTDELQTHGRGVVSQIQGISEEIGKLSTSVTTKRNKIVVSALLGLLSIFIGLTSYLLSQGVPWAS